MPSNKQSKIKKINVPLSLVNIDQTGCHIILEAKINRKKINLIVDTGASMTVFDSSLRGKYIESNEQENNIQSHGLGGNNEIVTNIGLIKKLQIGETVFNNISVMTVDLSYIQTIYKQHCGITISGLIGGDFLQLTNAIINYKTKKLTYYIT